VHEGVKYYYLIYIFVLEDQINLRVKDTKKLISHKLIHRSSSNSDDHFRSTPQIMTKSCQKSRSKLPKLAILLKISSFTPHSPLLGASVVDIR
jgi:hypothetical protein